MTTLTRPPQSERKTRLLNAAGVIAALTLAAGIGLWQQRGAGTDNSERAGATRSAVAATIPSMSGSAETPALSVPASTSSPQAPQLYIVATEEAARNLRASFAAFGQTDQPYEVRVVTPAEDDGSVLALLQERNQLRAENGLLPIDIVDLRQR